MGAGIWMWMVFAGRIDSYATGGGPNAVPLE